MPRPLLLLPVLLLALSCGGGSPPVPTPGETAPLVAAGATALDPTGEPGVARDVDLSRLGVETVEAFYALTTPPDTPFAFDVLFRGRGNAGRVCVSVAHALQDGATPTGASETLADAGLLVNGPGTTNRGVWLEATGDGFSRMSVRGAIEREQVLALQVCDDGGFGTALVRLSLGPESVINTAARTGGDYPGVLEEATLYSSDSWMFGLPTAAVSGDRTSVVCYEGDRGDPTTWARYEMRLQHEAASGTVTGGGSEETSPDSGNWRDHEIAALYNVLALVHGGDDAVTLKLSFDRGATFGQIETFSQETAAWRPRLVQLAMALDYRLALVYWRSNRDGSSDLVLVEGEPSAFDGSGSPTLFAFEPAAVVHHVSDDVTPTLMGVEWSEGGDLVIGYAFTTFRSLPDLRWESVTQNRCAVLPWGGELRDVLVEEDRVVGRDPSVAVLGAGDTMRVFFAYEGADGVRLRVSEDGGATYEDAVSIGDPSVHMPTVFARSDGAATRVDVLYLAQGSEGLEIHLSTWSDWGSSAPEVWRLTTARMEASDTPPPYPYPVPGPVPPGTGGGGGGGGGVPDAPAPALLPPPDYGWKITQVAFFGYDAVRDGDQIVVVYDEETFDAWEICFGAPWVAEDTLDFGADEGAAAPPSFVPAEPPPLAPGMTEEVPPPDPEHMHQLRLLRIE